MASHIFLGIWLTWQLYARNHVNLMAAKVYGIGLNERMNECRQRLLKSLGK